MDSPLTANRFGRIFPFREKRAFEILIRWQAFAFLLFRVFDIVKPPPIRYYERMFKSGLGVMLDDMIAAFFALIVLALARFAMGS